MSQKLTLSALTIAVPKNYKKDITPELIEELNLLIENPDYGQEFRETIVSSASILAGKEPFSLGQYVSAVKFVSLTMAGFSRVKAYCMVFPDRLEAREARGESISDMGGEASRFNATTAVNKIREQARIPLHLVNQGTVQAAINQLLYLMMNARSDVAKVSAATTLLKELRPPEVQNVELQIGMSDQALAVQEKQTEQLVSIAENQRRLLEAGANLNDIQQIHVTAIEAEVDEDE